MANALRAAKLATKRRQQEKSPDLVTRAAVTAPTTLNAPGVVANSYATDAPPGLEVFRTGPPRITTTPSGPRPGLGVGGEPGFYQNQPLAPESDKTSFARMANALLPFFSAQDQASVSTFLNTQDPTGMFKDYLGNLVTLPAQRTEQDAKVFASAARAQQALDKLDSMRNASGLTEEQLGSGYKFLKQAIGLLKQFGVNWAGGELGMSRAEYENMQAQLTAMNSQAESDRTLAPYAELATKFINPTLIGTLFPKSNVNGSTVYGQANKRLFG